MYRYRFIRRSLPLFLGLAATLAASAPVGATRPAVTHMDGLVVGITTLGPYTEGTVTVSYPSAKGVVRTNCAILRCRINVPDKVRVTFRETPRNSRSNPFLRWELTKTLNQRAPRIIKRVSFTTRMTLNTVVLAAYGGR